MEDLQEIMEVVRATDRQENMVIVQAVDLQESTTNPIADHHVVSAIHQASLLRVHISHHLLAHTIQPLQDRTTVVSIADIRAAVAVSEVDIVAEVLAAEDKRQVI